MLELCRSLRHVFKGIDCLAVCHPLLPLWGKLSILSHPGMFCLITSPWSLESLLRIKDTKTVSKRKSVLDCVIQLVICSQWWYKQLTQRLACIWGRSTLTEKKMSHVQWMQDAVWKDVSDGMQVMGKCALFKGALLPDLRTRLAGSWGLQFGKFHFVLFFSRSSF